MVEDITFHGRLGVLLTTAAAALRVRTPSAVHRPVSPRATRSLATQLPSVPSLIPRSWATCAIGLPVSRTIRTAPARNSGSNFRLVSAISPSSRSGPPRYEGKVKGLSGTGYGVPRGLRVASSNRLAVIRSTVSRVAAASRRGWITVPAAR